ncbi:PREDICTED: gustatory receptor for sugar taste 64a-like [Papilio xuthus]|uniref:Gustatory receptor for sugar taste 64a-like n=1 Tax=Papilio xuthus TaxID=66420 RepID=A0AAJ6ZA19_PAPXU|nr:PREDICTED: gustatory receptor for sugar taste 64a-like [Papilio xuthus]WCC57991.1 gustatory receptor 6 [Papilio xuthus]
MPKTIKKVNFRNDDVFHIQQPRDEFLTIMQQIFRCARFFGITGSCNYYWKLWGVVLLLCLTVVEIGSIWKVVKALAGWAVSTTGHRSVTARLAGATLYANAVLSLILTWRISSSWEKISDYWIIIEHSITNRIPRDEYLEKKMIAVQMFFIICGLAEHTMSVLAVIGLDCPPSHLLKRYILVSHGFLLQPTDYSISVAILLIVLSTVATILWNFQDLLLVLITLGLASRYRRINSYVASYCAKNKKEAVSKNADTVEIFTWRKIREAYVKQATLVRKVNDKIGTLILLSNSCNFYFTCLQLFLGISQGMTDTALTQMYYLSSFIWLCLRTTLVVLSAADVNVSSKGALPYIFEYPTEDYNLEIERLQYQLSKDYVALSGMGFFFLTKSLLLQMAGAVVTYELVLIQFDDTDHNSTDTINATMV